MGMPMKLKQDDAKLFKMYYSGEGILQGATITETPQQNGLAEMGNRKLLEMTRCLLIDSRLHKMLWGAAILHATTIRNLVVRQGQGEYPAELMRGIKPKLSISKLSIFGCTVLTRKRDRDVSKLEPKALEGNFVGYTEGDNAYLVFVPSTRKVVAIQYQIIKETEIRSMLNNTETPVLRN